MIKTLWISTAQRSLGIIIFQIMGLNVSFIRGIRATLEPREIKL